MKSFIIFAITIQTIYAISLQFLDISYGNNIICIDVPSCSAEYCILKIGQPLPFSVTFTAAKSSDNPSPISDASIIGYVEYYRGRYLYTTMDIPSLCNNHAIVCPMVEGNNYTVNSQFYISTEGADTNPNGFPETGLKTLYLDIHLEDSFGWRTIASPIFHLNFTQ